MGPLSGALSDKYGPRWIATLGMLITAVAFILLALMPYNFNYIQFGAVLFMMGVGSGMFGSPNSSSIMNSVPPQNRGVASGMMQTLNNTAMASSMAIFFTILIIGITQKFPEAMVTSLASIGASQLAPIFSNIPPTGALFAAFLGYNPVNTILSALPPQVVAQIPSTTISTMNGSTWFPTTFANAFIPSLKTSFIFGAFLSIVAAILSAMRGNSDLQKT